MMTLKMTRQDKTKIRQTISAYLSIIALCKEKDMACIKTLAESPGLDSIPLAYVFNKLDEQVVDEPIPTIDFSLLTSSSPEQRTEAIQELGRACHEWGFFRVVNHGVPERVMEAMISACGEFFNMTKEEKQEFEGKHVLDPIRCGTSFNSSVEQTFFWRDFLKVFVHPHFHSPPKPPRFSEVCLEYSNRSREVAIELLKAISESLGLEPLGINKALNVDSGLQILTANLYPPCPEPELAMGLPPHSDHSLLTLLIQNGIGGLQVQHNGHWVNVSPMPNSFLVNTADHLEIVSNGKYKSVLHRAVVNNRATRISIAVTHGPSLDTVVRPAPQLVDAQTNPAAYLGMKYEDYLLLQQSNKLDGKSGLDRVRIRAASD